VICTVKKETLIGIAVAGAAAIAAYYFLSRKAVEKAIDIISCSVSEKYVHDGDEVTIYVTFKNSASTDFNGVWRATINGLSTSSISITVPANSTKEVSQSVVIKNLSEGWKDIVININGLTKVFKKIINVTAPFSLKDLEIVDCTVSKKYVTHGETVVITGTYKNKHSVDTFNGTWNYEVYGFTSGIHKPITIGPGETVIDSQNFYVDYDLEPRTHSVTLYIGYPPPGDCIYKEFINKLVVKEFDVGNLEIVDCEVSKTQVKVGETITVRGLFKNNHPTAVFQGTWNLEVEGHGGTTKELALNPGESEWHSQQYKIPNLSPGWYAITLYLGLKPPGDYIYKTFGMIIEVIG